MPLQIDNLAWVHDVIGVKGEFELLHDIDGVFSKLLNQEIPLTKANTVLTGTCTTYRHGTSGRRGEREREREGGRGREKERGGERERGKERERYNYVPLPWLLRRADYGYFSHNTHSHMQREG